LTQLPIITHDVASIVSVFTSTRTIMPPIVASMASLPVSLMPLIGRTHEVATVATLLRQIDVRLVTLTGPGGVGKTRLAIAAAADVATTFPGGMWFIPLASIRNPDLVVTTIAQMVGVRDAGDTPLLERILASLRDRQGLLVLDNFEHVVDAAPLVTHLLSRCPDLTILVTSRVRLRLSGEREHLVPPLRLAGAGTGTVQEIVQSEAVHLFIERAQRVKDDFRVTSENANVVADVCRRLDGLPLAIELAAARIKVLPPAALLVRLEQRLPLLTRGNRDLPAHQQTMRDTIAWSYGLLSPEERLLFQRLAIFAGGFTMDAAEIVAVAPGENGAELLDEIASLVDQSLLRQEPSPSGEPRFTMLETIREFGMEGLAACEEAADLRARHAAYFLGLAEEADHAPHTSAKEDWSRRLEVEMPNLRAALAWAAKQCDTDPLVRLVSALWWFWESRSWLTEGSVWMERAVAASAQHPPKMRIRLVAQAAMCALWRGDADRAAVLLEHGPEDARAAEDELAVALVLLSLGHLAIERGEWTRAEAHLAEALARSRSLDAPGLSLEVLHRLGYLKALRGEHDEAEAHFGEILDMARVSGWRVPIAAALEALGTCARDRGDHRQAAHLYAEALGLIGDGVDPGIVANCLGSLAAVAAMMRRPEQAARLFGAAAVLWERHGYGEPPVAERARRDGAVAPARSALPDVAFVAAWSAGRDMPLEAAIAEALVVAREVGASAPSDPKAPAGLTPREVEVLRLVADGHADREIAAALFVSRSTVANHVANILSKLGVPSRAAAAAWAVRHNVA
jgi:predicted ATPase/DNA-binding CsgD family transcriptional regulator